MKSSALKWAMSTLLVIMLGGCCSANSQKEEQIAAIASHRATILSNNLPIEHGPLTIMQAKASGSVIEIMMIYNDEGRVSPQQLVKSASEFYCSNSEVKTNLEHGVSYNIKIRSSRGQLLSDQVISQQSCEATSN